MKNTYLEYYKMILAKVSFDRKLLVKEYKKAVNMLKAGEVEILNEWLMISGIFVAFDEIGGLVSN